MVPILMISEACVCIFFLEFFDMNKQAMKTNKQTMKTEKSRSHRQILNSELVHRVGQNYFCLNM